MGIHVISERQKKELPSLQATLQALIFFLR